MAEETKTEKTEKPAPKNNHQPIHRRIASQYTTVAGQTRRVASAAPIPASASQNVTSVFGTITMLGLAGLVVLHPAQFDSLLTKGIGVINTIIKGK